MDFIYKLIIGFVIGRLLALLFAIIVVYIDKINAKNNLIGEIILSLLLV